MFTGPSHEAGKKVTGRARGRTDDGAEGGMAGRGAERQCDSRMLQMPHKPSTSIPDEGKR